MRFEKVQLDQGGPPSTYVEVWLEETGDGYKMNWTEYIKGKGLSSTETFNLPDESYKNSFTRTEESSESKSYGSRTINPGVSEQFENSEVDHLLLLDDKLYEGFCGEIQAAHLYDRVDDSLDKESIGLYDFVEWYQQADNCTKEGILTFGPRYSFGAEDSVVRESLEEYLGKHELDGFELISSPEGASSQEDDVVGKIETDGNIESILRQTNVELANGLLTKNPQTIVETGEEE